MVLSKASGRRRRFAVAWVAASLSVAMVSASADVIRMRDGRAFQGKVLNDTASVVQIDAVVQGIRVEMKFNKADVAKVERADLPPDFFGPAPSVAATGSKPSASAPAGAVTYLEVPIVGRIGEQVTSLGLTRVLATAAQRGVKHIVFNVDSQGGSQDTAGEIVKVLRQYDRQITYHAIVRDAVGTALAVPIWCRTIHLKPGATIGGVALIYSAQRASTSVVHRALVSQAASECEIIAQNHGLPGRFFNAMIDPASQLCLWRDSAGKATGGWSVPADVPPDRVMFKGGQGQNTLVLSRADAIAVGIGSAFDGNAADLGKALGIPTWTLQSNAGQEIMAAAQLECSRARVNAASRAADETKRLSERRDRLIQHMQSSIADADQWDPSGSAGMGVSSEGVISGSPVQNTFTDRADATIRALRRAYDAAGDLINVETSAARLGLAPAFKPGELQGIRNSLDTRATVLFGERNRQAKIIRR